MAWPAGGIDTTQLSANDKSPSLARPSLLAAVNAVNDMAAARGAADGVASLGPDSQVPLAQLGNALPAGIGPLPYAGATAPTGWLLCFGQAVSRTTYAALFAAIGTNHGAGDGSTTFNLPDMRGRVPAGKDDMGGTAANRLTTAGSGVNGATLGATGGAETHTLTIAQMPAHTHDANGRTDRNTAAGGSDQVMMKNGTAGAITGGALTNGGGAAHNNTQPTLVTNYIIKT